MNRIFLRHLTALFLFLITFGSSLTSVLGQSASDTSFTNPKMDRLREEISTFINELTDFEMLDHSIQVRHQGKVREIKKRAKEAAKNNSTIPVGLTVFTQLHVDELWARALTGKWKYTEEGKQSTDYLIKGNGIDLTFDFDTSYDRHHFNVRPKAALNGILESSLQGLGMNPSEQEDSLNAILLYLFGGETTDLDKPNQANIDYVVEAFYHRTHFLMDSVWDALLQKTQQLKALYDDQNVKNMAKNLDLAIEGNKSGDSVYVLDANQKKFGKAIYEHYNTQLAEIAEVYEHPVYILYFQTNYAYNQMEIGQLTDRIFTESKQATKEDISLVIVQTFINDDLAPGNAITRTTTSSPETDAEETFKACRSTTAFENDELLYKALQNVVSAFYDKIPVDDKQTKLPVTSMIRMFNSEEGFYNTDQLQNEGYSAFIGMNPDQANSADVRIDSLYTPSGFPVRSLNGSLFSTGNAFRVLTSIHSGNNNYQAIFSVMPNAELNETTGDLISNPGIYFIGYWTRELLEKLREDDLIFLDEALMYVGNKGFAMQGRDYELLSNGDWVNAAFLNSKECVIEYAQVRHTDNVVAGMESPLKLLGPFRTPLKPENPDPSEYKVQFTVDPGLEDMDNAWFDPNKLLCSTNSIYERNGYGRIFLDRVMAKTSEYEWEMVIEIANMYDREDYLLLKELAAQPEERTSSSILGKLLHFTVLAQIDRSVEVLRHQMTWDEYRTYLYTSHAEFATILHRLEQVGENDADEISELILTFMTNYKLVYYVPYEERLKLLKILAEDGFGDEEDAALRIIASFASNEKDRVRFLGALEQPFDIDGPKVETLLEVLDACYYDPHVEGSNDLWHQFASLVSTMATLEYFDAKQFEAKMSDPENLFFMIRFWEYEESGWGYEVHKYESDFTASGANEIYIEYRADFQLFKGFTGEAVNNAELILNGLQSGGTPFILNATAPEKYEVKDTFHPLRDFMIVRTSPTKVHVYPAYYVRFLAGDKGIKRFNFYAEVAVDVVTVAMTVGTLGAASPLMFAIEAASIASAIVHSTTVVLEDLEMIDPTYAKAIKDATLVLDLVGMGVSLPRIIKKMPQTVQSIGDLAKVKNWRSFLKSSDQGKLVKVEESLVEVSTKCDELIRTSPELGAAIIKGTQTAEDLPANIKAIVKTFDEPTQLKFVEDYFDAGSDALRKAIGADEELVKVWKVLYPGIRRTSPDWLMQLDEWAKLGVQFEKSGGVTVLKTTSGKRFGRIQGDLIYMEYKGFGGDIPLNPDKPTIVLGKFSENLEDAGAMGTRQFLGHGDMVEGLPHGIIERIIHTTVPSKNRLAFLDLPMEEYNKIQNDAIKEVLIAKYGNQLDVSKITNQTVDEIKIIIKSDLVPEISVLELRDIVKQGIDLGGEEFWKVHNQPFLEAAFKRGDDIRLISDPASSNTGFYKQELGEIMEAGGLKDKYSYIYQTQIQMLMK